MLGRCWWCVLLPGFIVLSAWAQPPLRVLIDDDYPPYSFHDARGVLQGERIDVWKAWAAVNKTSVQVIGLPWGQAKAALLAGQGDVLDTLFVTPERRANYRFSPPYARIPVRLYFARQLTGVGDIHSLGAFTIAAKNGDACLHTLTEVGLHQMRTYVSYDAIIDAAQQHQVSVFCMDQSAAVYLLAHRGLLQQFRSTAAISEGSLAWAVVRSRPELYGEVQRGFARLPAQDVLSIERKWQGEELPAASWRKQYRSLIILVGVAALAILMLLIWGQTLRLRVLARTRALRRALQAVREARSRADDSRKGLEALIDAIPDVLLEIDVDGRCLSCRLPQHDVLAGAEVFMQAVGHSIGSLWSAASADVFSQALAETRQRGWSRGRVVYLELAAQQRCFELLIGSRKDADGNLGHFVVLLHDISRRKSLEDELRLHRTHLESLVQAKTQELHQANEQLQRQARLLRARSRSSQALIRAVDEHALQNEVCRILVEECGHRMATVSYVIQDEAQSLRPTAWAGEGVDYLQKIRLSWGDNLYGRGPAGRSLREGRPVVSDADQDPGYLPWREMALAHGFLSSIGLPFQFEDGQQGVFSIYAGQAHGFPDGEVALLQELVDDFAYGHSVLRLRIRQDETLQELRHHIETEQKARQESSTLSAYLREVLDALDSAIIVWGPDHRLRLWNQSLVRMFPQRAEWLQQGIDHDEYRRRLIETGAEVIPFSTWDHWDDSTIVKRSNAGRIVEYSRLSITDGSRIVIISDITETMQMRELMQRNERLSGLGRLVAGVAHELNTPIGVALTASTHLTHGLRQLQTVAAGSSLSRQTLQALLEQQRKATGLIEKSLLRAIDLIGNFKQVSVDQAGEARRDFDLAQVLHEVVETVRVLLKPEGHDIQLEGDGAISMDSFPGALGQVITNLVTNAIAHAYEQGQHGHLRLFYERQGEERVRLLFEDDGMGIPAEHMAHIFDPFFTTKLGKGGSGLGLHIVHTIVTDLLGGSVSVQSQPGQGAHFQIILPVHAPEEF